MFLFGTAVAFLVARTISGPGIYSSLSPFCDIFPVLSVCLWALLSHGPCCAERVCHFCKVLCSSPVPQRVSIDWLLFVTYIYTWTRLKVEVDMRRLLANWRRCLVLCVQQEGTFTRTTRVHDVAILFLVVRRLCCCCTKIKLPIVPTCSVSFPRKSLFLLRWMTYSLAEVNAYYSKVSPEKKSHHAASY